MTTLTRRKPLLWILFDFIGTALLIGGSFKYYEFDVPFISDFFAPFSVSLLISIGATIMLTSMILFFVPVLRSRHHTTDDDSSSNTVQRGER